MHWLHMTGGAALFSSSNMGRFNNDIALQHGRFLGQRGMIPLERLYASKDEIIFTLYSIGGSNTWRRI
jgi:hypothetical protein